MLASKDPSSVSGDIIHNILLINGIVQHLEQVNMNSRPHSRDVYIPIVIPYYTIFILKPVHALQDRLDYYRPIKRPGAFVGRYRPRDSHLHLVFSHNLNYLSDSHVTSSRLSLVLRVHFSLLFFDPVSLLMAYQHEKKGKTSLDFRHIVVVILVLANQ